jgi:CHAT domain-containing protein
VLATLWDVADEPTARLLPDFYRNLIAGQSRAEALRNAQLSLISDLRHGKVAVRTADGSVVLSEAPLFWAAFSLSGEP